LNGIENYEVFNGSDMRVVDCRAKVNVRAATSVRAARQTVRCQMQSERRATSVEIASVAAVAAALVIGAAPAAKADLVEDLLAKSSANAELHNKQRLASSYSNFARSRTVTDGTCKFPAVSGVYC
jgi:photosystem I subunit PsaN